MSRTGILAVGLPAVAIVLIGLVASAGAWGVATPLMLAASIAAAEAIDRAIRREPIPGAERLLGILVITLALLVFGGLAASASPWGFSTVTVGVAISVSWATANLAAIRRGVPRPDVQLPSLAARDWTFLGLAALITAASVGWAQLAAAPRFDEPVLQLWIVPAEAGVDVGVRHVGGSALEGGTIEVRVADEVLVEQAVDLDPGREVVVRVATDDLGADARVDAALLDPDGNALRRVWTVVDGG